MFHCHRPGRPEPLSDEECKALCNHYHWHDSSEVCEWYPSDLDPESKCKVVVLLRQQGRLVPRLPQEAR